MTCAQARLLSFLQLWCGYGGHNKYPLEEKRDADVVIHLLAYCDFRNNEISSAPAWGDADTPHYWPIPLFHHLSSQPDLASQTALKVYKPYELLTLARLELGMSLYPLVLLGAGMHCFPFTAAGAGLLSVQESHRWKHHFVCMGWVVWVRDCTPQPSPSWHLCLNPLVRFSWITKNSFCIARPRHRWAMTLGRDTLMIEVNQRIRDEQKKDY